MVWFLSLLAISFLVGIAVLFALDRFDQAGSDGTFPSTGIVLRMPPGPADLGIRGVVDLRPMALAGSSFNPDDF